MSCNNFWIITIILYGFNRDVKGLVKAGKKNGKKKRFLFNYKALTLNYIIIENLVVVVR